MRQMVVGAGLVLISIAVIGAVVASAQGSTAPAKTGHPTPAWSHRGWWIKPVRLWPTRRCTCIRRETAAATWRRLVTM